MFYKNPKMLSLGTLGLDHTQQFFYPSKKIFSLGEGMTYYLTEVAVKQTLKKKSNQ